MKESRKKSIKVLNSLWAEGMIKEDDYFDLLSYVVGLENETDNTYPYGISTWTSQPYSDVPTDTSKVCL